MDALGNLTTYTYDGNGNLKTKTDADGYVTTYGYNGLDMVTSINYNGGKEVSYQYNKVGNFVKMVDWTGTTTFEVDLLNRITKTTDTKGNVVGYTYDATGNQTSVSYPDGTTATKTYDLLGQLKTVTETDGRITTYTYDGMGRISKMEYPHGWVEDYHYDSIGQLLKVEDTDPTQKDMKQQKHVYEYDDCGNMTYEYMRGNGTGEATVENTYTYDALHRVTSVHENYGNDNRSYTYDSLGNLTYETAQGNKSVDYKLNNLNQITSSSDDGWKTSTTYTYDKRGNLVQELYTKNNKQSVTGAYTYDETNKMVQGVNDIGESSEYLYNGLGALVTNTWVIKKNAYGYHDVQLSAVVEGETVVDADSGKKAKKEKKTAEEVAASPELNKTSTVVKEFVVDYTTETYESLMEHEVGGLDYRYVYGNDRLSVNITGVENGSSKLIENGNQIRLYYHMDYLGTADYLTSPLTGKVESWTHYNEWGEITHNAVLKCGQRELDMVKRYATHDYDQVLGMYYAKARFYDAENRRFVAVDPIIDPSTHSINNMNKSVQLVQYLYVSNNPVNDLDLLGLISGAQMEQIGTANIWNKRNAYLAFSVATSMLRYPINPPSFGHNIAQIIAYTYYANLYSNSFINLEYAIDANNRADIVITQNPGTSRQTAYVGEIKPLSHLQYTKNNVPYSSLTSARNQLNRYMSRLVCMTVNNRPVFATVQPINQAMYSNTILLQTPGVLAPPCTYRMIVQTKGGQGLIGYEVKKTAGGRTSTVPVPQLYDEFVNSYNLKQREEATVQTLGRVRAKLGPAVKTIATVAVKTVVIAGVAYLTVQTGGAVLSFLASNVPTVYGTALAKSASYVLASFATSAAPQLVRLG